MQQPKSRSAAVGQSENPKEKVLLGHITGVVGLQGWVKVHSDTNPRDNITAYKQWWLEQSGSWKRWKVSDGRPQGKTIVAKLDGISTPEEAAVLIGSTIAVDRDQMPKLGRGEYYWADLTGMIVSTVQGVEIGPVIRLFETGANDVVVIADKREEREDKGRVEILVPWVVPDVVTEVNTDNRTIIIDWDPDF